MYGGIDLHSNNSVIAIVDCADRVVAQKRLPNEISKIIGFLARWRDGMAGASSAPIDSPHLRGRSIRATAASPRRSKDFGASAPDSMRSRSKSIW